MSKMQEAKLVSLKDQIEEESERLSKENKRKSKVSKFGGGSRPSVKKSNRK